MDVKKDQVIDFLTKVNDETSIDPQIQLLSSIIDRELRWNQDRINTFLNGLIVEIREDNFANSIPKIEFLVGALDNENSEALSKIKGE